MTKRTKNQELNTKNSAATAKNSAAMNQEQITIPIIELDLPEEIVDHLVEQGIKTLSELIEFSHDTEAMEAVLESDARQQVLSLIATYEQEPGSVEESANEREETAPQHADKPPVKAAAASTPPASLPEQTPLKPSRKRPEAASESDSLATRDSPLDSETDLIQKTDAQLRREFLSQVKEKAANESDDRLARMLAKAKFENDPDIVKIVNREIDKRFEATREKQMTCSIEIQYSDLLRRGYSASQESVSRFLHRQRLTHEAGVALARIHLAMKEGGVKLRNGKRVTSKSHVIQKLLEKAYEAIEKA